VFESQQGGKLRGGVLGTPIMVFWGGTKCWGIIKKKIYLEKSIRTVFWE